MGRDRNNLTEEEQREHFDKEYSRASGESVRNWDEKTKKRMNFIMGCVVLPLVVLMLGALVVGGMMGGG